MNYDELTTRKWTDDAKPASVAAGAALPVLLAAVIASTVATATRAQQVGCSASARLLRFACAADLRDDFTPLEPEVEGYKFYLPGVGLIVEVDPETGERLELIEFVPGS